MYLAMHPCDMMQVLNNYDVILQCMYVPSYPDKQPRSTTHILYFFDQTLRLLFISLLVLCGYYSRVATIRGQLLLEGGVYFF